MQRRPSKDADPTAHDEGAADARPIPAEGAGRPPTWRGGLGLLTGATRRLGVVSVTDQAAASATNFLTGIIIGRACTKDELGFYMLGFSLVFVAIELQSSLIATPYMVFSPRLQGRAHKAYTGSTLVHQGVLSALAILGLAVAGIPLWLGLGPAGLASVVWALALAITFILLREYVRRICFANLRMATALVADCAVAVLQLGGLLLLASRGLLSAGRAYGTIGAACGAVAIVWLLANRRMFTVGARQAKADFRRNWQFGKWVFASGVLWAASMYLFPWILAAFDGPAAAGVWAACLGIVNLGNVLLLGGQNFLGPKIANVYAESGPAALRGFVARAAALFCVPLFVFCVALVLVGGPLVELLYGAKYAGNGVVVAVLGFNLVASAVAFSFSRGLFTLERADVDFAINCVALGVLLTLGLWLVKTFGVVGAAAGLLMTNGGAAVARGVVFSRLTGALTARKTP